MLNKSETPKYLIKHQTEWLPELPNIELRKIG